MSILGKMIDITGQVFGRLTVIENVGKLDGRRYFWKCKCECGNVVVIEGARLRSGNTKSCGCGKYSGLKKYNQQQTENAIIESGSRFGKLVVIKPIGYKPQYNGALKNRLWYECQCDCGNVCEVSGNSLKNNHKISCGCIKSQGELIIENLLKNNNISYEREVVFPEMLQETKRRLRFDFVIYDSNKNVERIIEFDGRQHVTGPDTKYWGRSNDSLEDIQERDLIKNNFCLKHNYKLIRIPYTKLKTITIKDLLEDDYLVKEGGFCD